MEVLYIRRHLKSTLDTKVGYKALNTETALKHPQKNPKSNVTTQKRHKTLRLHNNFGQT